jgi:hypothetical protein
MGDGLLPDGAEAKGNTAANSKETKKNKHRSPSGYKAIKTSAADVSAGCFQNAKPHKGRLRPLQQLSLGWSPDG